MSSAPVRTVRYASELSQGEMAMRDPDPRLREYVQVYEGYTESATVFMSRREAAWPGVVWIINFGAPYRISGPAYGDSGPGQFEAGFVAGVADTWVNVEALGPAAGIQVNFTPLGAYRFLGMPMHELGDRPVTIDEALGVFGWDLRERLCEVATWERRFDLLDEAILARLAHTPAPAPAVEYAWRLIAASRGSIPVADLAERVGWSRKHLAGRFREQVGQTPKVSARLVRFQEVTRRLDADPAAVCWSDLAADCGYYDQAHLIRDFTRFAGSPPLEYLARRLPEGYGIIGD